MKAKRLMCFAAACVLGVCGLGALSACDEGNALREPEGEETLDGESDLIGDEEPEILGSFYDLQEAYDNGWLTQSDLLSIAYYNNFGRMFNEELMAEDYEPAPKTPETLTKTSEMGKVIRQSYWNAFFSEENGENYTVDDIDLYYYGCYEGCYAVIMVVNCGYALPVVEKRDINGVIFNFSGGHVIQIWKEN